MLQWEAKRTLRSAARVCVVILNGSSFEHEFRCHMPCSGWSL